MNSVEIKPGVLVIAEGRLGVVIQCLACAKVEVALRSPHKVIKCDLSKIECINPCYDPNNVQPSSQELERGHVSNDELEIASFRYGVIEKYKNNSLDRNEAVKLLGVSNSSFYDLLRMFDRDVGVVSLTRIRRGRRSGTRLLQPNQEVLIERAIRDAWKGRASTVAKVMRVLDDLCSANGVRCPSKTAVKKRIDQMNPRELHALKYGSESANQKFGSRPGKLLTHRPLEFVQMDHTKVDVIVVSEDNRKPLGRPWLTLLIDIHTRVILGYYIALHNPSTVSVSCAISMAAMPKQAFLKLLGREDVEYPFYGVPQNIYMDNAKEFKTSSFQRACAKNGIKPDWRPYGRKHYGGHVERVIGTMMSSHVHFLPGTTMSNTLQRKGVHSEKEAALTLKEFNRWFVGEIALYHGSKHSALDGSPTQEWNKFYINNPEGPRHPALISNAHDFRLDFMPDTTRNITAKGVSLFRIIYWSPLLKFYVGSKNVHIKYDPFSLKTIWINLNNEYIEVPFSDPTQPDVTYANQKICNRRRVNGSLDSDELRSIRSADDQIVKKSVKDTKRARITTAAVQDYHGSQLITAASAPQQTGRDKPDYSVKASPFRRGGEDD